MLRYIVTKLAYNLLRMGKALDHDQPWETDDTDTLVDKLDKNRLGIYNPYPEYQTWKTLDETWTPIRATRLLAKSLTHYEKHFNTFVGLGALYALPSFALTLYQPEDPNQNRIVFGLLMFLTLGVITAVLGQIRNGKSPSLPQSIPPTVHRMGDLCVLSVIGGAIPLTAMWWIEAHGGTVHTMDESFLLMLVFVGTPITGAAFSLLLWAFSLAGPVVVIEDLKALTALQRSYTLNREGRGTHILKALFRAIAVLGLTHIVLFYVMNTLVQYAFELPVNPSDPFATGSLILEIWDTALWMTLWPLLLILIGNSTFEVRDYLAYLETKDQDTTEWMDPNRDK